jgi:hypothetical protein
MTTMTPEKIREELAKPFSPDVLQTVNKGGTNLTYVPVAEVIARLNMVVGAGNWGDDTEVWISSEHPDSIVGKSKVWIRIGEEVAEVTGHGGDTIKFYGDKHKNAGKPLDLGDAYKTAASDAFKKACQKFGIGLDIARKEDALEAEAADRARIESEGYPLIGAEDTAELKDKIAKLSDTEKAALKKWWIKKIPASLDSGELTEYYLPIIKAELATYE